MGTNNEGTYAVKVACSPAKTLDACSRLGCEFDVQLGLAELLLYEGKRGLCVSVREGNGVQRFRVIDCKLLSVFCKQLVNSVNTSRKPFGVFSVVTQHDNMCDLNKGAI